LHVFHNTAHLGSVGAMASFYVTNTPRTRDVDWRKESHEFCFRWRWIRSGML